MLHLSCALINKVLKKKCAFFPVCLFNSIHSTWILTLSYGLKSNSFCKCKLLQLWPLGAPSGCPFNKPPNFFEHFLNFKHYKMSQAPCSSPEVNYFSRDLWFLIRKWYLEAKIWELLCLLVLGYQCFWTLSVDSNREHIT